MTPMERLAMSLDPVQLARTCGIEPDEWQAELLRSDANQILLNCSRQSGKSTMTAVLASHAALFLPGLILLASPTLRQSSELFRKTRDFLVTLKADISEESGLRLQLNNGARIVSLPGEAATIRGYSKPQLVILDEAAFIKDEMIAALRPMLAVSRGRLLMLSTPFGQRGQFFEAWENGGADWQRFKVTAYQCPRIDKAWLERERQQLGDYIFRSEYMGEFLGTLDSVFRYEDVERLGSSDVPPLFGGNKNDSQRRQTPDAPTVQPLFRRPGFGTI